MKRRIFGVLCTAAALAGLSAGCSSQKTAPTKREGAIYMETANQAQPAAGRRVLYPQESSEILHNTGKSRINSAALHIIFNCYFYQIFHFSYHL